MSAQHCPFHSIHTVVYCSQRKEETKNVHYNFNFGDVLCGSLTCGILSLVLPLIALVKQKNSLPFAAVSMGLCSLALLGQIFEYNVRVYAQDFSALLDTSFAIRFCAVALFLLAAVVNAGVCMYQMKRSVE